MNIKTILITGAAGFIGFYLCKRLVEQGFSVVGIDNINDCYDINLKYDRLKVLGIISSEARQWNTASQSVNKHIDFTFIRAHIEDIKSLDHFFDTYTFDVVCHLAAQTNVRSSEQHNDRYIETNIRGFLNVLECCRKYNTTRLVYASSSSVYGNSNELPFEEKVQTDYPISFYAATKKSNELMAHVYSHLYGIETIGLRFFTVYGPWGRPDMALFRFTDAILKGKPIDVYNHGDHVRDFTYIDDIIDGIESTLLHTSKNKALYKLYNVGTNSPVELLDFINYLEITTGIKSKRNMQPNQAGDVHQTWANVKNLNIDYGYKPKTSLKNGVNAFVKWYKDYYI
ncbi:MAG: NAD-dependent epimerase/dehydratase family protein [Proteobacteria bacterium]|nr:NAD-dependent epimerase/dehydratase family protein [Pseudomonadota bacterium]